MNDLAVLPAETHAKKLASQKRWRDANKARIAAYQRAYRNANGARLAEAARRRRATPEGQAATTSTERKRNAEVRAVYLRERSAERRRLIREAPGSATAEQIAARVAFYGGSCYLCGAEADETDHVIPLTRGGPHWPSNIRPICGLCNRRKSNKLLSEITSPTEETT